MVVAFEAQAEVWRAEQRIDVMGWRAAIRIHKNMLEDVLHIYNYPYSCVWWSRFKAVVFPVT